MFALNLIFDADKKAWEPWQAEPMSADCNHTCKLGKSNGIACPHDSCDLVTGAREVALPGSAKRRPPLLVRDAIDWLADELRSEIESQGTVGKGTESSVKLRRIDAIQAAFGNGQNATASQSAT